MTHAEILDQLLDETSLLYCQEGCAVDKRRCDALEAGALALRRQQEMPDWLARLSEIEWAGTYRNGYRCCPACRGTHPDGSIDLYGTGTRTNEGHRRDCWLHLALINEDAPALPEREQEPT